MAKYKLQHNKPECIGCGACAAVAPDFWVMNEADNKTDIILCKTLPNGWEERDIDEKDFEIIFQPFKRATTTGKYEGTGIGLAIVKRVVDFHGGRIWVSSKAGEGTTFHFTLPKVLEQRVA